MHSVEQIIKEEQAHRAQVAALSQMQLQAMERVEEQERELRRLSNLHQAILRSSPERPQQQSPPTSPPHNLAQLRGEIEDVLPGTVNTVRGVSERAGQIPDLGNLPTLRRDMLDDILAEQEEEEVPVTSPKVGQIFYTNSHCKTCRATQGDDSILQSVPGALC